MHRFSNKCLTSSNKKLLGTPGIAARSKDATRNKCIASSNKCLTSSDKKLLGTPGIATNGARTLLGTSASLLVTSALLDVTRSY